MGSRRPSSATMHQQRRIGKLFLPNCALDRPLRWSCTQLRVSGRSTQNGAQLVSLSFRFTPPCVCSCGFLGTATATYRLHPLIILNPSKPVPPHLAEKFAKCFPKGVIDVSADGAVSINERHMRNDTVSREVLRHKEFEGSVELKRIRDWFICMLLLFYPYHPPAGTPPSHSTLRP